MHFFFGGGVSTDKVGVYGLFLHGQSIALTLGGDGAEKESHIAAKNTHALYAFFILQDLFGVASVHHVPVAAAGDGHLADGEIFVQTVEGGRGASATGGADGGSHLHALAEGSGEEEAVQQVGQRAVGAGIVGGRTDDQAVGGLELGRQLVDGIVEDAMALLGTLVAGYAAADVAVANVHQLGGNALGLEGALHLAEGRIGTALGIGTAVD